MLVERKAPLLLVDYLGIFFDEKVSAIIIQVPLCSERDRVVTQRGSFIVLITEPEWSSRKMISRILTSLGTAHNLYRRNPVVSLLRLCRTGRCRAHPS